jgi:hypothetical protein
MATPNRKLQAARKTLPSRTATGKPMSRAELANLVNDHLWKNSGGKRQYSLTEHTLGRYERGEIHWPNAAYRVALQAVLRCSSAEELGFWPTPRGRTVDVVEAVRDEIANGTGYPLDLDQAVALLADLSAADHADSPGLGAADWSSATTTAVITGYLFGDALRLAEPAGSDTPLAERIRATTRYFMDLDFRFGGGHVRKMLLAYWTAEIVPELRNDHPEPVRRHILSAAAETAQILGWSAYDAGRHGVAQRYFVQCLRLARTAEDHLMGSRILSNLSHQANYLGLHTDAIQFARAAQAATMGRAPGPVDALLFAMEARALASTGDERGTVEALTRAETAFGRHDPDTAPEWISYFDALELAGETAHCFRDLGKPAGVAEFVTQAVDPALTPPRTRAFIGMVSATGALGAGDLDEALSIATRAVELAGGLTSRRYLRYIADFHRAITSTDARHSGVREFGDLVRSRHPEAVPAV